MPGSDHLKDLIELFLSNRISPRQLQELTSAMDDPAFTEGLDSVLKDSYYRHADTREDSPEDALLYLEALKARISRSEGVLTDAGLMAGGSSAGADPAVYAGQQLADVSGLQPEDVPGLQPNPRRAAVRRMLIRWIAAAVFLLAIGSAAYFYSARKKEPAALTSAAVRHFGGDVQPGSNKAILTLGDQSTISLDDAQNGQLASQGDARVLKNGNVLRYDAAGQGTGSGINGSGETASGVKGSGGGAHGNTSGGLIYNTITTPAGGQYKLVLADGTGVWLDSRSSIRFPTDFSGKDREVTVTGQVYLEVAPQPGKPFHVKVRDQLVEVLGTKFNINAFDNEPGIRTTLADGAVKVRLGNSELLLHPSEQAAADDKGNLQLVAHPDMEETLAWKDGLFHFSGTDINAIMRQMSRWYDVEIDYKETVPGAFVADIPRDVPLSQVLQLLELTGHVHFRIEGKKIVVSR